MAPGKDIASATLQKIQTAMMSICTALLIFCFKFLWTINATLSAQAITNEMNQDNVTEVKQKIEMLQNTEADHSIRITKLELKK